MREEQDIRTMEECFVGFGSTYLSLGQVRTVFRDSKNLLVLITT